MDQAQPPAVRPTIALGVLCGAGAALCWALGFVAARHGIDVGVSPFVLALHRYVWPGLLALPFLAKSGFAEIRSLGWGRAFTLAIFGGLPLALSSYVGYVFVPLGHGGIIQPSCAALGGLLLARFVLKEPLPARRLAGALTIVVGLAVIGAEALHTIGAHGVGGARLFAVSRFHLRQSDRRRLLGKSSAGDRTRHTRRSRRHLPFHPRRRSPWCVARRTVSLAGFAIRAADRIPCAWRR